MSAATTTTLALAVSHDGTLTRAAAHEFNLTLGKALTTGRTTQAQARTIARKAGLKVSFVSATSGAPVKATRKAPVKVQHAPSTGYVRSLMRQHAVDVAVREALGV